MCLLQREMDSPGIAMMAGAGIPTDASTPPQGQGLRPGGHLRRPPGPMGTLQMTPQVWPLFANTYSHWFTVFRKSYILLYPRQSL